MSSVGCPSEPFFFLYIFEREISSDFEENTQQPCTKRETFMSQQRKQQQKNPHNPSGSGGKPPKSGGGAQVISDGSRSRSATKNARSGGTSPSPSSPPSTTNYNKNKDKQDMRRPRFKVTDDVRLPNRTFTIVTTAALPWMTGTSVNPLLRAAYLANTRTEKDEEEREKEEEIKRKVALVVPWLPKCDQRQVFPKRQSFNYPEEQAEAMMEWVTNRVGFRPDVEVLFYPGRYATDKGSIVPVGDIIERIPMRLRDVAILEEPEHLNWFHCGRKGWKQEFNLVVGIIHTNYLEYARREENGEQKETFIRGLNFTMCRIYTHKVIKLSDAVQDFGEDAVTVNVHGVSRAFLDVGKRRADFAKENEKSGERLGFSKNCYFIAKVVWAKGYHELLDVVQEYNKSLAMKKEEKEGGLEYLPVSVFGDGDDLWDVKAECRTRKIPLDFKGRLDHLDKSIDDFKIFINPSLSDVVATTTAEALAMGKFVICAEHPSNAFFATFENCKTYASQEDFNRIMDECLRTEPKPMDDVARARLTWEAATSRLLDASEYPIRRDNASSLSGSSSSRSRSGTRKGQHNQTAVFFSPLKWLRKRASCILWRAIHMRLTKSEAMRVVCGGGAGTLKSPKNLVEWCPDYWTGGAFDRPPSIAQDLGLFTDDGDTN